MLAGVVPLFTANTTEFIVNNTIFTCKYCDTVTHYCAHLKLKKKNRLLDEVPKTYGVSKQHMPFSYVDQRMKMVRKLRTMKALISLRISAG